MARRPKPPAPTPPPATTPIYGASVLFGLDNPARDTDAAVAAHLNTIRIVDFLTTDPYEATRWSKVDTLIAAAKSRGLRVILDLSTYRNLLLAAGKDPYSIDWGPFIGFVANRYKAETAIALISLAGEPAPPNGSGPAPTTTELTDFYVKAASQWHAIDPARVVTSGGLLQLDWNSGIDWRSIFTALDYASVHIYSQADINYFPTVAAYAAGKMPLLIEEFGEPQGVGDFARASYFTAMYNRAKLFGAGVGFWNLGPDLRSDTYDVNTGTPLTWQAVVANHP